MVQDTVQIAASYSEPIAALITVYDRCNDIIDGELSPVHSRVPVRHFDGIVLVQFTICIISCANFTGIGVISRIGRRFPGFCPGQGIVLDAVLIQSKIIAIAIGHTLNTITIDSVAAAVGNCCVSIGSFHIIQPYCDSGLADCRLTCAGVVVVFGTLDNDVVVVVQSSILICAGNASGVGILTCIVGHSVIVWFCIQCSVFTVFHSHSEVVHSITVSVGDTTNIGNTVVAIFIGISLINSRISVGTIYVNQIYGDGGFLYIGVTGCCNGGTGLNRTVRINKFIIVAQAVIQCYSTCPGIDSICILGMVFIPECSIICHRNVS